MENSDVVISTKSSTVRKAEPKRAPQTREDIADEIAYLDEQIDALRDQIVDLKEQVVDLNDEIEILVTQREDLQGEISAAMKTIGQCR